MLNAQDSKKDFIYTETINVRYSDLLPILPSGLRVMIYDSLRYDRQNIGRNGGLVYLTELEKSFIICNNNTESIVFNDEITSVGAHAFSGCSVLEPFDLSNITYIGSNAFAYCQKFEIIDLIKRLVFQENR